MTDTTNTEPRKPTKRDRIVRLLTRESGTPELSRNEIAEKVGCTVQRVGEVVRELGLVTVKPKQTHAAAKKGLESRAAKATLTVVPDLPADDQEHASVEAIEAAFDAGAAAATLDYKGVMAKLAAGEPVSDADFDAAVLVARTRKMKRPVR